MECATPEARSNPQLWPQRMACLQRGESSPMPLRNLPQARQAQTWWMELVRSQAKGRSKSRASSLIDCMGDALIITKMSSIKRIGQFSYDLTKKLGEGNYGQVFVCWNTQDPERTFAVKKVERKLIDGDELLRTYFSCELNVLRKISNQNVLRFISFVMSQKSYYLITELTDGGDLGRQLQLRKRFGEEEVLDFLLQLLNGWRSLIKVGVVHRDLKPDNILIRGRTYKIADFGFAKPMEHHLSKLHKTRLGTPYYMAPQIHLNQPYSSKCDIWSLGVMLYRMLFGRLLLPAESKIKDYHDYFASAARVQLPERIENKLLQDFLQNCLVVSETGRMSWREVYQHPLVVGAFKDPFSQNQDLHRESLFRSKYLQKEIVLEKLFAQDWQKGRVCEQKFVAVMGKIGVEQTLAERVFRKFDKSRGLNLKELQNWIHEHEIPLGKSKRNLKKEVALSEILQLITRRLKETGKDAFDFFKEFDREDQDYLERAEFGLLLDSLGQYSEQAKDRLFAQFDLLGRGNVSLNSFRSMLFADEVSG